jgi:hypothetical protein
MATEAPIEVPSGQEMYFLDSAPGAPGTGLVYRFRFVAPDIGEGKIDFDSAAPDMEHLCNTYALPRVPNQGPRPSQIIISLSDRPVEFGTADPEATQFFEAYAVENDACVWEIY